MQIEVASLMQRVRALYEELFAECPHYTHRLIRTVCKFHTIFSSIFNSVFAGSRTARGTSD